MYEELDSLLLSQLRLAAMSYLMVVKEASSGNLSVQINKLQEAGYIIVEKTYRNNYPLTLCKITPAGIQAFEAFYQHLQTYFKEKPP